MKRQKQGKTRPDKAMQEVIQAGERTFGSLYCPTHHLRSQSCMCKRNRNKEEDQREEETWVEWVVRATRMAEGMAERAKIPDWVEEQRRRKWRWAGHVARRRDNRWAHRVLNWEPEEGRRRVGHPNRRWADVLEAFLQEFGVELQRGDWTIYAQDRWEWESMTEEFARYTLL